MNLMESWTEFCLWSLLGILLLPAIGLGLSAMARDIRVGHRPPSHPPGWENDQQSKRTNN